MSHEYRAHLENLDIIQFAQLLQKARKTTMSVKPPMAERSKSEKKNAPQALVVSTHEPMVREKRKREEEEEYPPIPCTDKEMNVVIDKWMVDGVLKPFKPMREPTPEDMRKSLYCRYHRYVGHGTRDCKAIRRTFHKEISDGTLNLTREQEVQRNPLPQHHRGKATAAVLFHNRANEIEAASDTGMPPAAISLQRSPTFRTFFNQLGLKEESRRATTEALVSIAVSSGTHCLTAEAHASRAFLETTNVITFTNKDMEVQHPDHSKPLYVAAQINNVQIRRALVDTGASLNLVPTSTLKVIGIPFSRIVGAPIEVFGFAGIHECTIGSIQLVLKVGPIVALTRFHVIDSPVSYHALLERP